MSESTCATPNINLGPYSGVELLSIFAAMALWGVTCMQTFLFFFLNRGDNRYLKLLVVWLWVMDTVHQCLLMSGNYKANTSGQVFLTDNVRTEYVIQIFFTALVSTPSQAFFSYRIWRFGGKHWIFPTVLVPAILFQFADGIILLYTLLGATVATQLTESANQALLISNFAVSAAVDILVSGGLCFLLWKSYIVEGSALRKTTSMLQRLLLFSINTGSWTAAVAIAAIVTLVVFPNNFIYVGFYFVLSPMYCNTLLANLNARSYLRAEDKTELIHLSGLSSTKGQSGTTENSSSQLTSTPKPTQFEPSSDSNQSLKARHVAMLNETDVEELPV